MPEIRFGAESYVHEAYGLPQVALENWYPEEAGERSDWGYRLIPTPGLDRFTSDVSGVGRGTGQSDVVASGNIIKVVGATVRRVSSSGVATLIPGNVANDNEPVRFAASQAEMILNSAGRVYRVTASSVTDITSNLTNAGASASIIDVDVIQNRHLYVEANSGRVFYSAPGNAADIRGFITAENDPDFLQGVVVIGTTAMLMGRKLIELWTITNSNDTPLIPRSGFVLPVGLIGRKAKTEVIEESRGTAYWVSADNSVYRWRGGREQDISTHWLSRTIGKLSQGEKSRIRLTSHIWEKHQFVKLHIPGKGDYFYDDLTGAWHRRKSLGNRVESWDYDYFVRAFGKVYVQRLSGGGLFCLDGDLFTENGEQVKRVATALVAVKRSEAVRNIIIEGQSGVADEATGDPMCMLRVAHDARVFKSEHRRLIGAVGEYRWRPVFGAMGTVRPPLVAFELSYTDPVGWTVYGATYNEKAD